MFLLDFMRRIKRVRCYSYCIGLDYDRKIFISQEQWEKEDVNVIAAVIIQDLKKLDISAKIVDRLYIPSTKETLIALKAGIKMKRGEYLYHSNYHMIVKKSDGYWYSKVGTLDPERLPLNIDIESWDWQSSNMNVPRRYYDSNVVYIAFTKQ